MLLAGGTPSTASSPVAVATAKPVLAAPTTKPGSFTEPLSQLAADDAAELISALLQAEGVQDIENLSEESYTEALTIIGKVAAAPAPVVPDEVVSAQQALASEWVASHQPGSEGWNQAKAASLGLDSPDTVDSTDAGALDGEVPDAN
jgi:hypothetical protein